MDTDKELAHKIQEKQEELNVLLGNAACQQIIASVEHIEYNVMGIYAPILRIDIDLKKRILA